MEEDMVKIKFGGIEKDVPRTVAKGIALLLPMYAESIISAIMPLYKTRGIEAARTVLAEAKARALSLVPNATEEFTSMGLGEGSELIKPEYAELLVTIAYDGVLKSMEDHYANVVVPKMKEDTH